ncbi:TetR/AcrR family transcriptional regulator [Nonomuraea sp. NPDC049028]|uniref:TetR/AcrR family transcriptional regulator n=1 Tax=Nonomuraea sp. NPDC049028 TaxID=3364348 RepID=UPI003719FF38
MSDTRAPRAMRADAQRNRARLLAAASAAFARAGVEASLDDIARDADVGSGTLYRHFPTREALVEAVLDNRYQALATAATELQAERSPHEALAAWLKLFVDHLMTYRGLAATVTTALHNETPPSDSACHAMRAAAYELVATAQRDGAVRDDIDASTILRLAAGVAWAHEQAPADRAGIGQMLAVLMDGLLRDSRVPRAVS